MSNHSEEFEKMKVQLHEKGYKDKDVTISSGKATVSYTHLTLPTNSRV